MSTLLFRHPNEADLALFAGGELGPLARWRIEGHVSGCDACRQAVADFFELRSRVMDLGELPQLDWAGMTAGIHRRYAQERKQPSPWAAVWSWMVRPSWAPTLALLALLAVGGYISRRYGPPANANGVSVGASARAVELRVGGQQVLLMNAPQNATQVNWRVTADTASARYLDPDTGNITVNNVYAQ